MAPSRPCGHLPRFAISQRDPAHRLVLVGLERFELSTSRLSSARSNQLSYRPGKRGGRPKRRKRNEDGGVPQEEPEAGASRAPCVSKHRERAKPRWLLTSKIPGILRKEVIQPQVPLRLPCYDFTPVADLTVAGCLLAVSAAPSGKPNSHGVTGGVYKARERIHRSVLICDY
jgi:hypothetical protein